MLYKLFPFEEFYNLTGYLGMPDPPTKKGSNTLKKHLMFNYMQKMNLNLHATQNIKL